MNCPPVLRPSYEFPSVEIPHLPPPPGFIEATKDMNFDIADVPKLAAKIPYFPPEMVYDAIHGGDESLELLTHNSLFASPTPGSLRRSDRMLQSPFKSIGDFLGGQSQSHHNPEGFVPKWDSWRHSSSNRRMDTDARLTPFTDVDMEHNFGPVVTKPLGVVPSRSVSSYSRPESRQIMPSTAPPRFLGASPRFSFGSDDLRTTQKIEDSISMDFREPVGRITYDTKANNYESSHIPGIHGAGISNFREEIKPLEIKDATVSEKDRPFIPSEEDFFSGLDRPNASEFELQGGNSIAYPKSSPQVGSQLGAKIDS